MNLSSIAPLIVPVITTLLSSVTSIIFAEIQSRNNRVKEVDALCLAKLYQPLMAVTMFSNNALTSSDIQKISDLIATNNVLASPQLISSWQIFIQNPECDGQQFFHLLVNRYNVLRMKLGYSYDKRLISKSIARSALFRISLAKITSLFAVLAAYLITAASYISAIISTRADGVIVFQEAAVTIVAILFLATFSISFLKLILKKGNR